MLGAVTGAFTDANAGSNKSVILSGLTLTGSGAANYTIVSSETVQTTAAITPLALTIVGAKALDGSATIAGSGLAAANVIGGDVVTFGGTATLASSSTGNQAITSFANLTQSNPNYTLVGASGSVYVGTKGLVLDHIVTDPTKVTIDGTSVLNQTTITQTSDKAIIDWLRFSINGNETVIFHQPSVTAITLNRVTGNEKSVIDGMLKAPDGGRVFILNSAGVLFGAGSSVNVGGLVASTQKMADTDFLAGNYALTLTGGVGPITAGGQITIDDGGFLALASQNGVTTTGTIGAPDGKVVLASAKNLTLTLDSAGSGLVSYAISNPSGSTNAGGTIDFHTLSGTGGGTARNGGGQRLHERLDPRHRK